MDIPEYESVVEIPKAAIAALLEEPVELIPSAERDLLIEASERDAFHLELRDDYSVPDEDGPYESRLRNEPVDYSFMKPWTQMVKRLVEKGRLYAALVLSLSRTPRTSGGSTAPRRTIWKPARMSAGY